MADGDIKIKDLSAALQIDDSAELVYTQDNGGTNTTFKAPVNQIARKVAEGITYTNLETTAKTLVGAINELSHLGNPILLGTTAPTSSQGANGNIYVQYTEGTGGDPDTVDGIYVKIDGAWCEISTGGGSGTTDYEDLSNKPQVNSVELVGNKSLDDLGIMPASLSKTVSGSIAHITDGADNIPVKSLVSQIVAVETGSGEKSPDNPYTISGFDSGVVTRCGKNFYQSGSVTEEFNGTFWSLGGTLGSNVPDGSLVLNAGTYTLSDFPTKEIRRFDETGARVDTAIGTMTFTLTKREKVRFAIVANSQAYNVQIEVGDTATTYEAYNGNTYTFTFGQTVYGGHFDNKGNLVVTHGIVDLGSLNWSDDALHISSSVSDMVDGNYSSDLSSYSCEQFVAKNRYDAWAIMVDGEFGTNHKAIRCKWSPSSTGAEFKTLVTGCKFVYPLAYPITLSITSQDIPTLLGENNIFSNTGDVEVDYYTDIADEIVEVAKATASTPLHNYSEDEHIVGTWIDGSTLYEKTVVKTINCDTEVTVVSSTDIPNIDTIVSTSGFLGSIPLDSYETVDYRSYSYINANNEVSCYCKWGSSATVTAKITIRYTKSST